MERVDRQATDLETGLYSLLQVCVVAGAAFLSGVFRVIDGHPGAFDVVVAFAIPALTALGLVAIFDKVAHRWRRIGAVPFFIIGIGGLIFISSFYDGRGISYADYPYLLAVHLLFGGSWLLCGLLVWRGRVLERRSVAEGSDGG